MMFHFRGASQRLSPYTDTSALIIKVNSYSQYQQSRFQKLRSPASRKKPASGRNRGKGASINYSGYLLQACSETVIELENAHNETGSRFSVSGV